MRGKSLFGNAKVSVSSVRRVRKIKLSLKSLLGLPKVARRETGASTGEKSATKFMSPPTKVGTEQSTERRDLIILVLSTQSRPETKSKLKT